VGELVFYTGTMDSGKSTLALQTDYNHASRGRRGLILSSRDRSGSGRLSSRLGLSVPALEVDEALDLWSLVTELLQSGEALHYVIADEAQFYTEAQVEDLARIADDLGLDVFAFGITTDFRTRLFPGSRRLLELADRVAPLQVEALCWCGARAIHNARTLGGQMVTEGEQVMVGDVAAAGATLGYEVLCRSHYRRGETAASARAPLGDDTLFG
jgi:thymidine kinase